MANIPNGSKTAAIYLRVNTNDQIEEGSSIENQRELLQAWAKLWGYKIYDEYSDRGYSGRTPDRPGFQRMLRDAEAGRFQLVVVTTADRFTRDAFEMLKAIDELERNGVALAPIIATRVIWCAGFWCHRQLGEVPTHLTPQSIRTC